MKRILTLLAVLATAVAAHAQTDSLVIFNTQGEQLELSIAGFNISLGDDVEETYTDAIIYHEPRRKKVTTNFLGVGFGGMVLTPAHITVHGKDRKTFLTSTRAAAQE